MMTHTTSSEVKLRECPLCGSSEIRSVPMPLINDDESDRRWWVGCANALDHDADAFGPTREEAEAIWNRRASPRRTATMTEFVERMKAYATAGDLNAGAVPVMRKDLYNAITALEAREAERDVVLEEALKAAPRTTEGAEDRWHRGFAAGVREFSENIRVLMQQPTEAQPAPQAGPTILDELYRGGRVEYSNDAKMYDVYRVAESVSARLVDIERRLSAMGVKR